MDDTIKKWNPAKYQCPDCKTVIWSRYPGQFCSCKCGECFVDQTEYYARIGGKPELFEEGTENE